MLSLNLRSFGTSASLAPQRGSSLRGEQQASDPKDMMGTLFLTPGSLSAARLLAQLKNFPYPALAPHPEVSSLSLPPHPEEGL